MRRIELPPLKHDFYNALVHQARLGPRQELTLELELWSGQRHFGNGQRITIRFGGVFNFDEVSQFFDNFDVSRNRWEGLHFLHYDAERQSKPNDLWVCLQFDRTSDEICIHCRNITVSE